MFIKIVSWNTGFQRLKQIQCVGVTFHKVSLGFFPNSLFFLTRCKPSSCFSGFILLAVTSGKPFLFDGLFLFFFSSRQRCIKEMA